MVEWGSIGFLLGAIVCIVFFGMGVCCGTNRNSKVCNKKQPDTDSDVRIYTYSRDRDRNCDRHNMERFSREEIARVLVMLLSDYKNSLSPHEKDVLRYIKEKAVESQESEEV